MRSPPAGSMRSLRSPRCRVRDTRDAIMAAMVTKAPEETADRGLQEARSDAPSSWGLGDGAAIPWEYAPAPEARDIVTIKERYGLFIGGKDVAASDGKTFVTVNPATEEPLALVARATATD